MENSNILKTIKLQKLIANSGFCARRTAEKLIKQGKVTYNNKLANIGDRVPLSCDIKINGKSISTKIIKKIYLILNKPTGYVSTMQDEKNRKTAYSLVKNKIKNRVFLVGRLDLNSQGLMLFTNDGDLAYKITHPKYGILKKYEVEINRKLQNFEIKKLETGIKLEDGVTAPAKIKIINNLKNDKYVFKIQITIHEGKKRQIRRMIATLPNAKVVKLKRTQIGNIKLNNLPLGQVRFLNQNEVKKLKQITHL